MVELHEMSVLCLTEIFICIHQIMAMEKLSLTLSFSQSRLKKSYNTSEKY